MALARPPKKSETIEIRLSHEAKAAFIEHCRQEQQSASEIIRLLIDERISPVANSQSRRLPRWPILAAGIAGTLVGMGAAAPSLARATQDNCVAIGQTDQGHGDVVSRQEIRRR